MPMTGFEPGTLRFEVRCDNQHTNCARENEAPATPIAKAQRRGAMTNISSDGAAGVIRHILQQLEEIKNIEKCSKGGRKMTRMGQQDLDRIAGQCSKKEENDED